MDGADLLPAPSSFDEDDPLYDDHDESRKYILSSSNGQSDFGSTEISGYDPVAARIIYGPLLTLAEFKIRVDESIKEYFDSADADEVIRAIEELKCKDYHPEVVKRSVSVSLDKGPRERELVSRLLTCLHPHPLQDSDLEKGFETLLDSLDDLIIDIPDAKVSFSVRTSILPVTTSLLTLWPFSEYCW
jgi:programmed cell death protein 4